MKCGASHLLPLLFLLLLCVSAPWSAVHAATMDCPITYDDGLSWCQTAFGRGGTVTLDSWAARTFSCGCNGAESITVSVSNISASGTYQCVWNTTFDEYPGGSYCYAITGTCPSQCSDISSEICDTENWNCATTNGSYSYECQMCNGRTYNITGSSTSCTRSYTDAIDCNPATTCSGHGCCEVTTSSPQGECVCYSNSTLGYFAGTRCMSCLSGYYTRGDIQCLYTSPDIPTLFASIAKTWTMVLPNMAAMGLVALWILVRRMWHSDRIFDLTELRRAKLSAVQIARRGRGKDIFRYKYIPRRPAASRSFVNERYPVRGPPAY